MNSRISNLIKKQSSPEVAAKSSPSKGTPSQVKKGRVLKISSSKKLSQAHTPNNPIGSSLESLDIPVKNLEHDSETSRRFISSQGDCQHLVFRKKGEKSSSQISSLIFSGDPQDLLRIRKSTEQTPFKETRRLRASQPMVNALVQIGIQAGNGSLTERDGAELSFTRE